MLSYIIIDLADHPLLCNKHAHQCSGSPEAPAASLAAPHPPACRTLLMQTANRSPSLRMVGLREPGSKLFEGYCMGIIYGILAKAPLGCVKGVLTIAHIKERQTRAHVKDLMVLTFLWSP